MYISMEVISSAAQLVSSLAVFLGMIFTVYRFIQRDRVQCIAIKDIQTEQTLLCYGVKACLQGLAEQGCDGPVHDALDKLDKHLNQKAHQGALESFSNNGKDSFL